MAAKRRSAAGRRQRSASGLGEAPAGARRPHALAAVRSARLPGTHPLVGGAAALRGCIVQLAATASRALPGVASHAIGFAAPGPAVREPGIGA